MVQFSNHSHSPPDSFSTSTHKVPKRSESRLSKDTKLEPHTLCLCSRSTRRSGIQHKDTEPPRTWAQGLRCRTAGKGIPRLSSRRASLSAIWVGSDSKKQWIQGHLPNCVTLIRSLPLFQNTSFTELLGHSLLQPLPACLGSCVCPGDASSSSPLSSIASQGSVRPASPVPVRDAEKLQIRFHLVESAPSLPTFIAWVTQINLLFLSPSFPSFFCHII